MMIIKAATGIHSRVVGSVNKSLNEFKEKIFTEILRSLESAFENRTRKQTLEALQIQLRNYAMTSICIRLYEATKNTLDLEMTMA